MSTTEKKIENFSSFISNGIINQNYEGVSKEEELFRVLVTYYKACGSEGGTLESLYLAPILEIEDTLNTIKDVEEALYNLICTYTIIDGQAERLLEEASVGKAVEVKGNGINEEIKIYFLINEKVIKETRKELEKWKDCEICFRPTLKSQLTECENCGKWYCEDCEEDCYRCIDCWDSILILPEEEEGEE